MASLVQANDFLFQATFSENYIKSCQEEHETRCSATYLTPTLDLCEKSISRAGRFNPGYNPKLLIWLGGWLRLLSGLDCLGEKKICAPFLVVRHLVDLTKALYIKWRLCLTEFVELKQQCIANTWRLLSVSNSAQCKMFWTILLTDSPLCKIFWVLNLNHIHSARHLISQLKITKHFVRYEGESNENLKYLLIYWTQKLHNDFIFLCSIVLPPVGHSSNYEYHCWNLQDNGAVIRIFIALLRFSVDSPSCFDP